MKHLLLPIASLALLTSSASADVAVPGSVANVTFALTLTSSIPGTVNKDADGKPIKTGPLAGPSYENEWEVSNEARKTEEKTYEFVSKMKAVKFGNKELLIKLVEQGVLAKHDTKAPHIAGWAIVVVNATSINERGYPEQHSDTFYAVHKAAEDIVDLSNHIGYGYGADYAENGTFKEVIKRTEVETPNETSTTTVTAAFNWKESIHFHINFSGFENATNAPTLVGGFDIMGVFAIGNKLTTVGTPKAPVIVDTAGKITGISGAGPFTDPESERAVVEGSISFAPGKAQTDVTGYPNLETISEDL